MSKKEFQDFVGVFFFQKQNSRYRKLKIIEREPFKRAELVIYINNLFFCFIFYNISCFMDKLQSLSHYIILYKSLTSPMVIDKDNTDDPWLYWHFHTIIDSHRGRSVLPGARIAAHEK